MSAAAHGPIFIDGLQYCNWSREVFLEMRAGGMTAVHATVSYHEGIRETIRNLADWNWRFRDHADLILPGRRGGDVELARASGRTAIFLGLQNPMPIEDDLGLVEILHQLGIRFAQLTYNNQSLLGCGWMETDDTGITRMGREVIAEMNRLGMVVDMSHSGERTALDAIEISTRPIAISHANPRWLRDTARNISKPVMKALKDSGGMLGLSLYPHHLPRSSETTLREFGEMAAEAAAVIGVEHLGIGSDLCQGQPPSTLRWMREGRWTRPASADAAPAFPRQPEWFKTNADFPGLAEGLASVGFRAGEISRMLGGNWHDFFNASFGAASGQSIPTAKQRPGTA
jgi:microsomal dipeptidase-like Zn-dependent dipeptidase